MNFQSTSCCGAREITQLASHKAAYSAMAAFCKQDLEKGTVYSGFSKAPKHLSTCYLFTAAVYDKDCRDWKKKYANLPDIEDGMWFPYGHRFAAYIEANKLGKVVTGGAYVNEAFHADHKVQAWLWYPDRDALLAWWDKAKVRLALWEAEDSLGRAKENLRLYGTVESGDHIYYADYVKVAEKEYQKELKKVEAYEASLLAGNAVVTATTVVTATELVAA